MSSTVSSPLTLELKPAWPALGMLSAWLLVLAASCWQSAMPVSIRLMTSIGVLLPGAFIVSRQLPGLVSHALCRATRAPDGVWTLANGRGEQWEGTLMAPVRFMRAGALLRWTSHRGRHWALATDRSCGAEAFRRLRVTLRFS